jgi:hypothetical protein
MGRLQQAEAHWLLGIVDISIYLIRSIVDGWSSRDCTDHYSEPMGARRFLLAGVSLAVLSMSVSSASGASESQSKAVEVAAAHTEAQHSAHLILTLSGDALKGITAIGSGSANLATGAMKVNVHYEGSSKVAGLVLDELFVHNHLYIDSIDHGESISTLLPGKSWVEEPPGATEGTGSSNPAELLAVLASHGNAVLNLGASKVSGASVIGYSVTPSSTYLRASIEKEHIPASLKTDALQFLKNGPPTYNVWVDSHDLMRRLTMVFPVRASGTTKHEIVRMDFSDFGAPISIAAPSASSVASYAQFQAAAQQSTATQ